MESIFLFCFAFGAFFTLLTTLLGLLGAGLHGLGSHVHLPGSMHGVGHGVGHGLGHGAGHGIGHGAGHAIAHGAMQGAHGLGSAAGHAHHAAHGGTHAGHLLEAAHGTSLPSLALAIFLNPSALLVGVSLFGGLGYIAMHHLLWPLAFALALAVPSGLTGTALVGGFMAKLRQDAGTMHDQDYALAGTLASVTVTIAKGAVGEIVFTMGGVRRSEGARAMAGGAIAKGTQVVIMGYDRGLALVEPASRVTAELMAPTTDSQTTPTPTRQAEENG